MNYSRRAALRFSASNPRGLPPGARELDDEPRGLDFGRGRAQPSTSGVPVVLVHGTNGRSSCDWFTLAPLLANLGLDVYAFNWRRHLVGPDEPSATHVHALDLGKFIDTVQEATGADYVDLVAHSWGAVVAQYLVRCLPNQPGAGSVRRLVGLAPTYGGTTVLGLATHQHRLPPKARHWLDTKVPTWREQLPGSTVLSAIQAAPPAPGRVRYTTIVSRYDQIVTPYTASLAALPHAAHVVVQDHDKRALVGHIGILHHRVAMTNVARALRPALSSSTATTRPASRSRAAEPSSRFRRPGTQEPPKAGECAIPLLVSHEDFLVG